MSTYITQLQELVIETPIFKSFVDYITLEYAIPYLANIHTLSSLSLTIDRESFDGSDDESNPGETLYQILSLPGLTSLRLRIVEQELPLGQLDGINIFQQAIKKNSLLFAGYAELSIIVAHGQHDDVLTDDMFYAFNNATKLRRLEFRTQTP
jgi:hypothetical protein